MGEGSDKIARSLLDLEPSAIIDLFVIYPDIVNSPESYAPIHNGSIFKKGVVWQGTTYIPVAIEIDGFEVNADGRVNRPKIKISNKDYFVTTMLKKHNDFKNARVSRKRTLVKFLDDENFDGGNPYGESDPSAQISEEQYIVSQKVQENKIYVELELTSPLDLDNFQVNSRRIVGKYCYWKYRGDGCQYKGSPIQKEDGKPFSDIYEKQLPITGLSQQEEYSKEVNYTTGDVVFTRNNRVMVSDPNGLGSPRPLLNYYVAKTDIRGLDPDNNPKFWDRDGCNKKLSSCKLRFTSDQIVTRFVSSEEVEKITAKIISYNDSTPVSIDFKPKKQLPFLQTLSGTGGWTMAYSFVRNPGLSSKGQTFYLSTNLTVYNGLEMTHYDRSNIDYLYYKDLNGTSRYIGVKPTSEPSVDGEEGYKFVTRVTPENTELSHYNPRTKVKTRGVNGYNTNQIYNFFKVLTVDKTSNWNTSYTRNGVLDTEVEGVCFWDRTLSDEEIDLLYRKLDNGALKMRPYDEFADSQIPAEQAILNGLLGWWDQPFALDNRTGFQDQSNEKNDLIYNGGNNNTQPFKKLHKYNYSVNKNVSTQEELSYLPFGGFPGTDGFGFQRA